MSNYIDLSRVDNNIKLSVTPNGDGTYSLDTTGGTTTSGTGLTDTELRASDLKMTLDGEAVILGESSAHIGDVGCKSVVISCTPTIMASGYADGDCVGGKLTLTNAMRTLGGTGMLLGITVIDKGNQKSNLEMIFFDSDPSAATLTDNEAIVFSTDVSKIAGRASISASDYVTTNSVAIASVNPGGTGLSQLFAASGTRNLYAVARTNGSTPTYLSTSDLIFRFKFIDD